MRFVMHAVAVLALPSLMLAQATTPAPSPILPADGTIVAQNDPQSGCPVDPVRGSGFQILFRWSPVEKARAYEIHVYRVGASKEILRREVSGTETVLQRCGYVVDSNLADWKWQVRALLGDGKQTGWSRSGVFRFAPCRVASGAPCGTSSGGAR